MQVYDLQLKIIKMGHLRLDGGERMSTLEEAKKREEKKALWTSSLQSTRLMSEDNSNRNTLHGLILPHPLPLRDL